MNLTSEDKRLLEELCQQHGVSADKVLKLLDTVRDYEFKERRTGVYDALRKSFRERYLRPALADGLIEMIIPDKPNSRLQKYRLTDKGRQWLAQHRGG